MSKRINNRKDKLGRSPKHNKHIVLSPRSKKDLFSPYRIRYVNAAIGSGGWR